MLEKREQSLTERQQQIEEMESKVEATLEKQETELQRISGYTSDQAKQIILERVKKEVTHESALMIKESDRKSTRLNSSHVAISYAVFCLKKKKMKLTN